MPTFDQTADAGAELDQPYPDDDGTSPDEAEPTPLADLEAELTADIAGDPVRLEVEGRPGWVAIYRRDVTGAELEKWRKQAKRGKKEPDPVHLAGLIVAGTMLGLERAGEPVNDDEGEPLTVRSPYLQRLLEAVSAVETARAYFGTDGYLSAHAEGILDGAGWGSEALDADPS